jgi:hypothetical protein
MQGLGGVHPHGTQSQRSLPSQNRAFANKDAIRTRNNDMQAPTRAPKAPATEQKGLHPSWEAKKKQKEKEGVGILPSKGKKIVF